MLFYTKTVTIPTQQFGPDVYVNIPKWPGDPTIGPNRWPFLSGKIWDQLKNLLSSCSVHFMPVCLSQRSRPVKREQSREFFISCFFQAIPWCFWFTLFRIRLYIFEMLVYWLVCWYCGINFYKILRRHNTNPTGLVVEKGEVTRELNFDSEVFIGNIIKMHILEP